MGMQPQLPGIPLLNALTGAERIILDTGGATPVETTVADILALVQINQGTQIETFNPVPNAATAAAASANVNAIQLALNIGGLVTLQTPGVYYINEPLVLFSFTKLKLAPGVIIRALAGMSSQMIVNNAWVNLAFNTCTVTWALANGLTCPVQWNGHGQVAGNAVVMKGTAGTTDSSFSGVFTVVRVIDQNNILINLRRYPTVTYTGTTPTLPNMTGCVIKQADRQIIIDGQGGGVDWNFPANTFALPANTYNNNMVNISGVDGIEIRDLTLYNNVQFSILLAAVRSFIVENIHAPLSYSEACGINGPAWDGIVRNIHGEGGDDSVSLATWITAPYTAGDTSGAGDMLDITIDSISMGQSDPTGSTNNALGTVRIVANPSQVMDNINIKNVSQCGRNGSNITIQSLVAGAGIIKRLTVENCSAMFVPLATPVSAFCYVNNVTIDELVFRNCIGQVDADIASTAVSFFINASGATTTIRELLVEGCTLDVTGTGVYPMFNTGAGAVIGNLVMRRCKMTSTYSAGFGNIFCYIEGGTVNSVKITECNLKNLFHAFYSVGTVLSLVFTNNRLEALDVGCTFAGTAACNVSIGGNNIVTSLNLGLILCGATSTITVDSFGGNVGVPSGKWIDITAGGIVNLRGWDFQMDITLIARFDGGYCYNTNASIGGGATLTNTGLVGCQGTSSGSWFLLASPLLQTY